MSQSSAAEAKADKPVLSETVNHAAIHSILLAAVKKADEPKIIHQLNELPKRDDLVHIAVTTDHGLKLLDYSNKQMNSALRKRDDNPDRKVRFEKLARIACIVASAAAGKYPHELKH